jgi:hypothetical protein
MSEEKNLPAGQASIPPKDIPQEQPVKKETADETISSAEPITKAEQQPPGPGGQTTNLSSEAFAKEDNQPQTEKDMKVHHITHPARMGFSLALVTFHLKLKLCLGESSF